MNNKQYNILLAVIILLVLVFCIVKLIYDIYKYNSLNSNVKFPPWPSRCPDYWEVVNSTDTELKCKNVHNVGICNLTDDKTKEFSGAEYTGSKGPYYKCTWANECRVPWEGVDNLCA